MHPRGSGFFGFSYATLTLGYLVITLMLFAVPSKPMSIGAVVLAIFLFTDVCIILGVSRIRIEEGWVGVASVAWATFICFYSIIQNVSVTWGKKEEEERLTGREETRRSVGEWMAVMTQIVLMVILALVSILLTATLILRARDSSLAPPGKKYYVNEESYQVHLACIGNTTEHSQLTVLIEAGETPVEQSLQPFIDDTYQTGSISRYCYWDRPGIAWSDNAPSPHSAGMSADTLAQALASANETGPWILVSAGIGSIPSRIFASRHTLNVKGLFLIDPMHESFLPSLGQPGRGFLLWLRGILSPLGIDRLAGALFKGRSREDRVFGISSDQTGKSIKARLQENLVAGSVTTSEIRSARQVQMSDMPLVVVSSGVEVKKSEKWADAQKDLAGLTKTLHAWDVVDGAPHEVWASEEGRRVLGKRLKELVGG